MIITQKINVKNKYYGTNRQIRFSGGDREKD